MSDDTSLTDTSGSGSNGDSPESATNEGSSEVVREDRPSPEDSFAVVGNRTRLSILRELHDRVAVADRTEYAVPFTELREAVGESDSGKFSYHLNQLLGGFVEKRPDGYAILYPGIELVRTVKSGAVAPTERAVSDPTTASCFRCGAPVAVAYTNGFVSAQCTECSGALGFDHMPDGALSSLPVPGGAVGDDIDTAPEELLDRVHGRFCHRARTFGDGSCPRCGGPTESRLRGCPDHDASDGPCAECGTSMAATVRMTCEVCSEGGISPPACVVGHRTPFREALADAGVDDLGYDAFAHSAGLSMRVVESDEPTVEYDLPAGPVRLVVDGDVRIWSVT